MSAELLRDRTKRKLAAAIGEEQGYLGERTAETVDQMRLRQGRIDGMKRAIAIIDETYSETP